MELVDEEKGLYRQRFHGIDFKLLSEVEDYEKGRLATHRIRVTGSRYYLGEKNGIAVVLLDLYFKSLINQRMDADILFNYNT